jgi:hypothetical protein
MVTSVRAATSLDDGVASPTPQYAVGDVHGCADQLRAALRRYALLNQDGRWIGGNANVHFLGDLTDRGPDGIGVIDTVMDLQRQADDAGGRVTCLLGNHEVMLLAAHLLPGRRQRVATERFRERWLANGGRESDSERLTDAHIAWLSELPAVVPVADHLLVHSDSDGYLDYGDSVDQVNAAVSDVLHDTRDLDAWEQCTHLLTARLAFATDDGEAVRRFLDVLGGLQLIHGHSPVPLLLGIPPAAVTGPLIYAGGRAVNMDTGTFLGGPCLVNALPSIPGGPLHPLDVDDLPTQVLPPVVI